MQFYMPVKVFQEKECVRKHPEVFDGFGKKALLITGRNSAKRNGSYEDVTSVLNSQGIAYVLFDEVEENPSIETVMKARDFGLQNEAEFVIGIGGGSPLDAAKAVALMMYHKNEGAEYLYEKKDSSRLPLILIPTTCGTGSEVTGVSVMTIHAKKTKGSISHRIFADYALIDGKYLAFAPDQVIQNTAVDALGHLWESYLNADATDYSRMCADAGMRLFSRTKEALYQRAKAPEGERTYTEEDYTNLMNASMFAGMAIAQDSTSVPHGLSYPITYAIHMPHGAAIGYFQAGYLAEASEEDRRHMLTTAGFSSLEEWQEFYETLCQKEPLPEELLEYAVDVIGANEEKLKKAPFPCNREVLHRIAFWSRK